MKALAEKLRDPKALAGIIVGAILLALLLSFSDIRQVAAAFRQFPLILAPVLFGLVLGREVIRTVEWHFLLMPLRVKVKWRHTTEALLSGDAAQILPAGIFLQNYVLRQTDEADVSRTLAATFAMQFLEAAVGLVVVAIVTVPGWWALRPAALLVMAGAAAFMFLVTRPAVLDWIRHRGRRKHFGAWLAGQIESLLQSLSCLGNWWIISRAFLLTAAYMAFSVATLYVITRAYSVPHVTWLSAMVIYCFTLVVIVLNPIPSDWGVSEGLGTAMFLAYSVKPAVGLTMMLLLRFTIILSTMLMTAVTAAIFREDVKEVVSGDPVDFDPAA